MKMKYNNISLMKTILLLISFLYLISNISSSTSISINQNILKKNRNLQYSLGSIYYELQYPINDLTGTGDRLKDVPYKVLCKILACDTGCCVGEIDKMSCGISTDCAIYLESLNTNRLVIAVCIVVILLVIFFILLIVFKKVFEFSYYTSLCLTLGSMSIILIPYVVYYIIKEKKNCNGKDKSKDG